MMGWAEDTNLRALYSGPEPEVWLAQMHLFRPTVPEGATYFRLRELRLISDGLMSVHTYLQTPPGAPVPSCAVVQGWQDGPSLPADSVPAGGEPRGYPNRGNAAFSNANGVCEWVWGAGEGFDPRKTEGAHWYWVPAGPTGIYSDVVYGFGWRWGTNHYHLEPVFERVEGGEEPPPPEPGDGEVAAAIRDGLHEVAQAILSLGG